MAVKKPIITPILCNFFKLPANKPANPKSPMETGIWKKDKLPISPIVVPILAPTPTPPI